MTANSVNLVNKDDTWRAFLALLEHIAHPACTNTDKHLDKVRTRNGEERYIRLAGNGFGQQCLTCTRRANKQHALWNFAAKTLELAGIF